MMTENPRPLQARPYEDHAPLQLIRTVEEEEEEDDEDGAYEDDGGEETMDEAEDVSMKVLNHHKYGGQRQQLYGGGSGVVEVSRTSELTLAFEGEVYVFPAVTPDKVVSIFRKLFNCFFYFLFSVFGCSHQIID